MKKGVSTYNKHLKKQCREYQEIKDPENQEYWLKISKKKLPPLIKYQKRNA